MPSARTPCVTASPQGWSNRGAEETDACKRANLAIPHCRLIAVLFACAKIHVFEACDWLETKGVSRQTTCLPWEGLGANWPTPHSNQGLFSHGEPFGVVDTAGIDVVFFGDNRL